MAINSNKMILPVVDETFEDHFIDRTWDSPQDQVDATYPRYIQPTNPTAKFVYTHDVGALIVQDVLITVICPIDQTVPTVELSPTIEISTDAMSWSTASTLLQAFVGNFRYVRITLDFAADDDHELALVGPVRLRITLKRKRDAGNGTSDAVTGETVNFNLPFISVRSIVVTAAYNASYPTQAVYDFVSTAYPTSFDVYVYRTDTGAQVAEAFSWSAEGV